MALLPRTPILLLIVLLVLLAGTVLYKQYEQDREAGLAYDVAEELVAGAPKTLSVSASLVASPGGFIEKEYTCDRMEKQPQLTIEGLPEDTKSIAVVMYDPDAPMRTFIHWLQIVPHRGGANATITPGDGVMGLNSMGSTDYYPPCPPQGSKPHRYYILVLALDRDPGLPQGFTIDDLKRTAEGHVLAWGYTYGLYSRS